MKTELFSDPFAEVRLQPVRVGGKEIQSKLAVQVQNPNQLRFGPVSA